MDYELTALGQTLLATVLQLKDWTIEHVDDIEQARRAYDASLSAAQPGALTAAQPDAG